MRILTLDFLLEIKQKKNLFDTRLIIKVNQILFYFIGIQLSEELLIIRAENHNDAIDFVNNVQQINNAAYYSAFK